MEMTQENFNWVVDSIDWLRGEAEHSRRTEQLLAPTLKSFIKTDDAIVEIFQEILRTLDELENSLPTAGDTSDDLRRSRERLENIRGWIDTALKTIATFGNLLA